MICNGISLRQALSLARELRLDVRNAPGTGEWLVSAAGLPSVRQDARRKDASRALVHLLRLVARQAENSNT